MTDPSANEPTPEMQAAQRELDDATARAAHVGARQQGLSLERVGGALDAEQLRSDMEQMQRQVKRAHTDVQRAADRVKREMDRMMSEVRSDLEKRMAKVTAALEPVQKRIELMQEGIETLGLYLSAAQGVVVVRDGKRAGDQEPIIIRQMVLTMDEETGLFAEHDGMTADDVAEFDRWLLADPAHVNQIVPEQKCVVALVARWREREHGNPWSHDQTDKVTHFLIRNGEALFRTTVNDFHAGTVLIPRADEFIDFFRSTRFNFETREDEVNTLRPGTRQYAEAMDKSDKRSRHFLRIGLIFQGLVDIPQQRPDLPSVFAPLHPAGINMLTDPSERSEKVRIICDAEGGLESGQETFLQWQERLNAALRPGMRIIGAFNGMPWREADEWSDNKHRSGHSRVYPTGWDYPHPPSGVPMLIEERRPDGGLVCRFDRGLVDDPDLWTPNPHRPGYGWTGGKRPSKRRASVTVYPTDGFILSYDAIESSQQLRGFLASRRNRREYREMWPLIRAAMFAKAAEEEAEAPFITMLSGVLARENDVSVEQAAQDVPELVRWFKLKNRWARALTLQTMTGVEADDAGVEPAPDLNERTRQGRLTSAALDARRQMDARATYDADRWREETRRQAQAAAPAGNPHEALAVRMIVAEHARRLADRRRPINAKLVAELKARHPEALLIARPRRGGYLVLAPAHPTENIWVHELDYTAKGELRERTDWRLAGGRDRVSRWTVCYEHPRFADWDVHASERDHLRGPEIDQLAEQLRDRTARADDEALLMVSYTPATVERRGRFTAWVMLTEDIDGYHQMGYVARDYLWNRAGDGTLSLLRPRSVTYWTEDEHRWSLEHTVSAPWEGQYAAKHAGQTVWGPDQDALARWLKIRHAYLKKMERDRATGKRATALAGSVAGQWRALRVRALHAEFLADVPDARWEEWEEYLEDNSPEWTWSDSHHHPYGDLGAVVRFLLDAGIDPTGLTAQQSLERAREAGLPEFWDGFRSSRNQFPAAFPDEWASLVIGADPVPTPQAPEPEPEPDESPDTGAFKLADGIEVLDAEPERAERDRDEFDELRDAMRGL